MYINLLNAIEGEKYSINLFQKGDNNLFDGRNIEFFSEINFVGYFIKNENNVYVNGAIKADMKGLCEKCQEELFWNIDIPFEETFYEDTYENCFYYQGHHLELDDAITEKILFSIPILLLCKEDCKGLCPKCGCNLNYESCNCNNIIDDKNPFAILKSIVGGAKEDGSTKK